MKKRFVSMLLALSMCMGLAVPSFAVEPTEGKVTLEQIETEIQAEKDRIYAMVHEQLEAQGVLGLMDSYREILDPQIERNVIFKHTEDGTLPENMVVPYSSGIRGFNFPNGGVIGYRNLDSGVHFLATYMDEDTTDKYLIKPETPSFILDSVISYILEKFTETHWGIVYFSLKFLYALRNDAVKRDVAKAGGTGYILAVEDTATAESGTVTLGWYGYPYVEIDLSKYEVEQWEAGKNR